MSNYLVDSTDLTSVANAIRAKSGGSSPLEFPTDFVSEIGSIPSGGGSNIVASGTVTGNDTTKVTFSAGSKMPQKDFAVVMWMSVGTEYPRNSTNKIIYTEIFVDSTYISFDLSSNGEKTPTFANNDYTENDSGTIITKSVSSIPNASLSFQTGAIKPNYRTPDVKITRSNDGFSVYVSIGTDKFVSGFTYNWKIVYFGNNPSSDIVEVSA